jgi:hypothetical protein
MAGFAEKKNGTDETNEKRIGCKLLKTWSHPPGLNRRPADYETIRVKSHQ